MTSLDDMDGQGIYFEGISVVAVAGTRVFEKVKAIPLHVGLYYGKPFSEFYRQNVK